MKAAIHEIYGPPDVLRIREVEKPVPRDHEVLIKVYATTVNRTDTAMLRAKPFIICFFTGLLKPVKPVPGTDFAGRIEAVGKAVEVFKVGGRVFGFDDQGVSSKAEYMIFSADKALATMPENITYVQAAACVEGAHYALNFINKVNIKPRQKALVNGAAGAIGSAVVQFLKYYGASATAVCSTKNIELI